MELCTQCKLPEEAHRRRIFGHDFKRPQPAVDSNPNYAADLVDALAPLADAPVSVESGDGGAAAADCSGDAGGGDGGCGGE